MRKEELGPTSSANLNLILKAHKEAHGRFPNGKEGFGAFQRIVVIFGTDWSWKYEPGHWLKFRLSRTHEGGYSWICHFAKKLERVAEIPGASQVISRLDKMNSYPGAWGEFDAAFKLTVSGYRCRFGQHESKPTPDLFATREGQAFEIEVTTTTPSRKEGFAFAGFNAVEWTAFTNKCVARGLFSRIPDPKEIQLIETRVREKCEEAQEKQGVVKLNIRSLMTYFVAPWDMLDEIPEPWRHNNRMKAIRRISPTERLVRIVGEKAGPQLSNATNALLFVYDLDTLRSLWSNQDRPEDYDASQIQLALGGFANLAGMVLVQPFVSVVDLESKDVVECDRRLIEHSLLDFDAERCRAWRNPMADNPAVFDEIVDCLVAHPSFTRKALSCESDNLKKSVSDFNP